MRPDKPIPFPDLNLPTPDPDSNDDLPDEDGPYDEYQRKPPDSYRDCWYHSDHLGSSTYLTDNFGRPSHYYETLPFGEMIVEHNQSSFYDNKYKFNGKELDDATGMYYYGARYYDPRISIFVSVDPLAEETMTPYQYVYNNPIMFTDPTGMAGEHIGLGTNEVGSRKLNSKEQSAIIKGLQAQTDDQLSYNSDKNRIEIKKFGSGSKKEGTELIRKSIGSSKTLTINMNTDGEYGMVGATSGATNGDTHNESNGVGTNVSISLGFGHDIYTQDSKGKISTERLSIEDMLSHELVHSLAQMNGETSPGFKDNTAIYYTDPNGKSQIEMVPREEYLTVFGDRTSKKIKNYRYPTENRLRNEQGKTKRINYLRQKQIKR